MAIDRVTITNFERWGNLVKTWATGRNYLADGNSYPVPETVDQLLTQLALAQVGATVPTRFKSVHFLSADQETLVIRLPPKEMIEDSEAQFEAGAVYALPPFYKRVFNNTDPNIPDAEKLKFHAERIGDYTIRTCM